MDATLAGIIVITLALLTTVAIVAIVVFGQNNLAKFMPRVPTEIIITPPQRTRQRSISDHSASIHNAPSRWSRALDSRSVVFISCSHKDSQERDKLLEHLGVLQSAGRIYVWHAEDQIGPGAEWEQEITQAIARATVAILLITNNYLTSDFILNAEIPALLQRRSAREGLAIVPIIAKPCAWREFPWLAEIQVRPKDSQPLWSKGDIDGELQAIAEEVAGILKS